MFSLMKQQERRLSRGEETILASPVRPTKRRHHRDSFNKHEVDESGATMVVLTPVKATPNQQRKTQMRNDSDTCEEEYSSDEARKGRYYHG